MEELPFPSYPSSKNGFPHSMEDAYSLRDMTVQIASQLLSGTWSSLLCCPVLLYNVSRPPQT